MKIKAAVLQAMGLTSPYADSRPLRVEEIELSHVVRIVDRLERNGLRRKPWRCRGRRDGRRRSLKPDLRKLRDLRH